MILSTASHATELSLVALTGKQAAGMPNGVTYSSLYFPLIDSAGQFAFIAELSGSGVSSSNDSALFLGQPGAFIPVAREGDHAPGTPDGVRYSSFEGRNRFMAWNAQGQFAFPAGLSGPGITSSNNQGIWFGENNSVSLVTRTGNLADGLSGNRRSLSSMDH